MRRPKKGATAKLVKDNKGRIVGCLFHMWKTDDKGQRHPDSGASQLNIAVDATEDPQFAQTQATRALKEWMNKYQASADSLTVDWILP